VGRLIAGEFGKVLSTRLWLWLLLASAGVAALYASLNIAFADNTVTFPLSTPEGQQTLFGVAAGAAKPLAAVLGAVGLTGEFRHRTVTATFLATPHRGRVVVAKLATHAVIGAAYGLVCTVVVAVIALAWLPAKGIDVSLTGNGLPSRIAGGILAVAIFAMIGVGLGALLREQVATVVTLLVYLYVVEPIVTRIPALSDWTIYLPGPAGSSLTGIALTNQTFLSAWQGALVLTGYGMAFAAAGVYLAMRRDVT
jgi:ABC-type transport system involved in multi-copper enzyme maturation permease subunit